MNDKNLAEVYHCYIDNESAEKETSSSVRGRENLIGRDLPLRKSKERIIAAALQLFSEKGFFETHIPDIALRAKIGVGTIYRNFRNKDHLFNESFRKCLFEFLSFLEKEVGERSDRREKFFLLWTGIGSFFKERPSEFLFLNRFFCSAHLDAESQRDFLGLKLKLAVYFRSDYAEDFSDICASLVIGSFLGLVRLQSNESGGPDQRIIRRAAEILWGGFSQMNGLNESQITRSEDVDKTLG
ncbi:transcriptional regulator, TetR family [Leptospira inadai serovar Lyme str. 10]|uniref:Transcriptional regulator, TetR family n=2 Tax=Leptospira inadai serovar Lyme TaxID=293084 RepID=V6HH05_9LEPT|nr:TetR/AcrR family transcriptional regulator [Leptospira inadai]EQA35210.1 transcriptional regulator, TetR family [Leptospira inadai serovar Lyme str. 10]PNV76190.1 TetR/AcrR family transcriptional regulator [Leptospira inadai serovar Lyme]